MISVSLKTGRSALELCEIGEQGGLTTDGGTRLYALRGGRQTCRCGLTFQNSFWEFIDELQPSEGTHKGVGSEALKAPQGVSDSSYLVDPASSHMLVSKIKPCMSKYKQICTVKLRMAH